MITLDLPLWPERQPIHAIEAAIVQTQFDDLVPHHGPIIKRVLQEEDAAKHLRPSVGAQLKCSKIRRPDLWGLPEFDLLNARAQALFRLVLKTEKVATDACWANVYRKWSAISPHSHRRAMASLVYCLDDGGADADNPESGQFAFVDPRLQACCPFEEGRVTNALCPEFRPGTMLIFPGQTVHYVKLFTGPRPRITASWNMNLEPLPDATEGQRPV